MKLLLISIIIFIPLQNISALENKIIAKIENEIITTIDVENEKNYLKALNPKIKNISEQKLNLISKNSLIREKIKKNEILKYTDKITLDEMFLNRLCYYCFFDLVLSYYFLCLVALDYIRADINVCL